MIEAWGHGVTTGPAADLYAFRSAADGQLYYADRGDAHLPSGQAAGVRVYQIEGDVLVPVTADVAALELLPAPRTTLQQVQDETGLLRYLGGDGYAYFGDRAETQSFFRWQEPATGRFSFRALNDATGQVETFFGTAEDPLDGTLYAADNSTALTGPERAQLSLFQKQLAPLDPVGDAATIAGLTAYLAPVPAGNLRLTGGELGAVRNLLALRSSGDVTADLGGTTWTVTGAAGEIEVSGGDQVSLDASLRANHAVTVRSTGLFLPDGTRIGGDVRLAGDIRGQAADDAIGTTLVSARATSSSSTWRCSAGT